MQLYLIPLLSLLVFTGCTASQDDLYNAAFQGNIVEVEKLIKKGADPNKPNSLDGYPLHGAVLGGQLNVVKLLISKGANVNQKDPLTNQNTLANGGYGNFSIAQTLVQAGAEINHQGTNEGRTLPSPLLWAILHNNDDVALYLLEQGADPTLKDFKGRTPLEVAKSKNKLNIVQTLETALKNRTEK
jgi:ankyrin repeat protein